MASRSFSIHGQGIKFETRVDIEPYLKQIREIPGGVEEVHFGGNTLGVEPCVALAEVLKETTTLKVSPTTIYNVQLPINYKGVLTHIRPFQ